MAAVATDYYFMASNMDDEDFREWFFVKKDFWQENNCIDDQFDEELEGILPKGFLNSSESAYSIYNVPAEEGTRLLVEAGFTQIDNPWEPDASDEN